MTVNKNSGDHNLFEVIGFFNSILSFDDEGSEVNTLITENDNVRGMFDADESYVNDMIFKNAFVTI